MTIPGAGVILPSVVERLLLDVVADGFVLYCCGRRTDPNALVASYEWARCVDLVTIRDFERVTTARVPKRGKIDVFAPHVVVWAYEGPPQWALRALLDLVHPEHPDAPTAEFPAPPCLHIPRAEQRPMTIRPPTAGRVGARAARLAAKIPPARRSWHRDDGTDRGQRGLVADDQLPICGVGGVRYRVPAVGRSGS